MTTTIKLSELFDGLKTAVAEGVREALPAAAPVETDEQKTARVAREAAEAAARLAPSPAAPAGAQPAAVAVVAPTALVAPPVNGAAGRGQPIPTAAVDLMAGAQGNGKFSRYSYNPWHRAGERNKGPEFMVRRYQAGDQALCSRVINMARHLIVNRDPAGWQRWLAERALGEDTGATGGFLVPDEFAADVIMKEGELTPFASSEFIRIIPMGTDTMLVPVLETRPTVGRFRENQPPVANTEPAWNRVELRARKFGEVLPISNEMLADENIGVLEFLRDLFAEILAENRNELVTNGAGAQEPQGFRNDARIATFGFTGTQTDSAAIIDWVDALYWRLKATEAVNAVWTASSLMLETLDKIKDGEGRPLMGNLTDAPFRTLKGAVVLRNDSIPNNLGGGTNESELIFGNFKKYIFGDRQQMAIDQDQGGKFFEANQTAMRITERYDGRVGQPDAFIIGTGKIVG